MKNSNLVFCQFLKNGFLIGIGFNIFTIVALIIYTLLVENIAQPFDFNPNIEFGTEVSGTHIFSKTNTANSEIHPSWQIIESKFSFFIPATEFRFNRKDKAVRVEKWCKTRNCCAHRMAYNDKRKSNFNCFTVDDWFTNNSNFLDDSFQGAAMVPLNNFLKTLPKGSRVIINEPLIFFQQNKFNFSVFEKWVVELASKYPYLKFQVGIQLHFQWIDLQFFALSDGVLFAQLAQFSRQHNIPWGISEFSTYDRVWRRRLVNHFDKNFDRGKITYESQIELLIPERFRRAVVLHQAYWIHQQAVRSGAQFVVEWGNFPLIWFASQIDPEYQSTFGLFDWYGNPQPMYWAIARGLTDGKKLKN